MQQGFVSFGKLPPWPRAGDLYLYFEWAILSSGTLYTIETTCKSLTYNGLNSMLSDQNSFDFHITSLQRSPSLCFFFLLVYSFLSICWFPTPLSVPHQTDGPRAVQRFLLPAVAHVPAVYQPYQVPFAQECLYMIYFLTEFNHLLSQKVFSPSLVQPGIALHPLFSRVKEDRKRHPETEPIRAADLR